MQVGVHQDGMKLGGVHVGVEQGGTKPVRGGPVKQLVHNNN